MVICVVGSLRWQCVLLRLLGGNVCCWVLYVEIRIVGSFRWQYVLYVLDSNVGCSIFMCQCVLMYVKDGNVCCRVF